jgi:hypothetical protein
VSPLIGILLVLGFAAAQGVVVFVTAWLALKFFKLQSNWWKPTLMAISWIFWITFTLVGYFALGGEGGFMDGMGMVLMLCMTCLVSTFVYTIVWVAARKTKVETNG